jgi:RHS repeat-associated protein
VTRPLGARTDFDYTRDGNTYDLPQSRFVLSRVSVDDGQHGDGADVQTTTYSYSGGVYDRLEREFDGYASVVRHEVDPANHDAVLRSVTRQYRTDGHYTKGLVTREVTADGAGHPFVQTDNTYELRDVANPSVTADPRSTTATVFPPLVRTDKQFFEGQPTAGKSTFTTTDYDEFGNVTHTFDAGDQGATDDLDVRVAYSADDPTCRANHIIGVADRIEVTGGGTVMRHRESTVDCANGNLTQVRAALNNTSTAITDLGYFANGNLQTVTQPANKTGQRYRLDYTYDNAVSTHVASIVDRFGYRSSMTYDNKFGTVATTTDENNQVIRNTRDSVGRLSTVTGPYEAPENRVTISFEYHPEATVPYAVTRHVDRQADGSVRTDTLDTVTFVDGIDRVIQTKADAAVSTGPNTPPADVMVVSGRLAFDALGRTVKQFFPVTEPKGSANTTFNATFDSVQPTVRTFDVLDRETSTVLPDNTTYTTAYDFGPDRAGVTRFETVATDANGKTTRIFQDVRKRRTAIKESNPAGGQSVVWTSFGYDALDQETSIVDDKNNTTTMAYDNLGRQTATTSPDSGRTDLGYDLAGNMTSKVTAKLAAGGQAIEYDYDFNRLGAIRYPVFPANNVTYTYGAPGAPDNGANRITSLVDGAGTVTRKYGPLGEVTSETRTTTGQNNKPVSFTTGHQYDTWNRVLKLTYPDGEVLSYHYDSGGQVDSATGVNGGFTYQYLKRLDYDKFGQRVLLDTGNGTRTQYSYDSENRRLTNLKANLAQGYVFQNLDYGYDNVGNVTSTVNDTVAPSGPEVGVQVGGPSTQTFQYDDLNQLVHAQGSYQPRGPKTDTYTVDLQYDSIHNITSKVQTHQLVSNGNPQTDDKLTYDYGYGYTGAGPHQPITIGGYTFSYDANGNEISRTQQPGPRRQMIWDEENRLACSHENVQSQTLPQTPASCDNAGGTPNDARYLYDDQGNRIVKDSAQLHIYPNQNYSTSGNFAFKHVFIGTTRLVTKTVERNRFEDQQFYSHGDDLGSTGFVTDANGDLAEHLEYLPGGETWVSEHPSQPVPQQYTGKELDPETNLYYYGARYYDPRTQVWQSTDPAVPGTVNNSKDLSVYLYGKANPVRYADPDGRQAADTTSGTPDLVKEFFDLVAMQTVKDSVGPYYTWPDKNVDTSILSPKEKWQAAQGTPVIGRLKDTTDWAKKPGYTKANLTPWTLEKNDAWVQTIIDQGGVVLAVSPRTQDNLWNPVRGEPTVFAREIFQLQQSGYTWKGDFLLPPPPPGSPPARLALVTTQPQAPNPKT